MATVSPGDTMSAPTRGADDRPRHMTTTPVADALHFEIPQRCPMRRVIGRRGPRTVRRTCGSHGVSTRGWRGRRAHPFDFDLGICLATLVTIGKVNGGRDGASSQRTAPLPRSAKLRFALKSPRGAPDNPPESPRPLAPGVRFPWRSVMDDRHPFGPRRPRNANYRKAFTG